MFDSFEDSKRNGLVSTILSKLGGIEAFVREHKSFDHASASDLVLNVNDFGAVGDGSTNDSASIQSAVDSSLLNGGIIFFPSGKTYAIGSSILIPNGITRTLSFYGYGATLKLISTCEGAFKYDNTYPTIPTYSTFSNISIFGFTVDVNNSNQGGVAIFGGVVGYVQNNFENIKIKDCNVINAHSNIVNSWTGIGISSFHATQSEATTTSIRNVLIEGVIIKGCYYGIFIGGGLDHIDTGLPSVASTSMYNVKLVRCWHDAKFYSDTYYAFANFQLGGYADGEDISISDCYGRGSQDVGIEIDNFDDCLIENCIIIDAAYAFYLTNFIAPKNPSIQIITMNNNVARKEDYTYGDGDGYGIYISPGGAGTLPVVMGNVIINNFTYYDNDSAHPRATGTSPIAIVPVVDGYSVLSLVVNTVFIRVENLTWNNASDLSVPLISLNLSSGAAAPQYLNIENVFIYFRAVRSGAGSIVFKGLNIFSRKLKTAIKNISIDCVVTGAAASSMNGIYLGLGGGYSNIIDGEIKNVKIINLGDDSGAIGVSVAGQNNLAISEAILIADSSFSGLPAASTNDVITNTGGGTDNIIRTILRNNYWKVSKVSANIGVGASPYTHQNLNGYPIDIAVSGGTVSDISISVDGTNYYSSGLTSGIFNVGHAYYLKVTYSSAPTMTQIPSKYI